MLLFTASISTGGQTAPVDFLRNDIRKAKMDWEKWGQLRVHIYPIAPLQSCCSLTTAANASHNFKEAAGLTQKDLQSISEQLQALSLLFHNIHALSVLVIVAVHTGVGQHLEKYGSYC